MHVNTLTGDTGPLTVVSELDVDALRSADHNVVTVIGDDPQ